jgi:hypothetical protein
VTDEELRAFEALIDGWAQRELAANPVVAAVDRDVELRRWYMRLRGEEKETSTVWLTLGQRTLHYESYFMPAPEENVEHVYEYLLRLNTRLFAMRFAVGEEDAVYLVGQMPLSALDEDELDRILGSAYAYSEQHFRPAMRIGFASRFKG